VESQLIEVMIVKMHSIQFALVVNLIQMKWMKMIYTKKNMINQEFQHCVESQLIEVYANLSARRPPSVKLHWIPACFHGDHRPMKSPSPGFRWRSLEAGAISRRLCHSIQPLSHL
jgi:hypothetical protein